MADSTVDNQIPAQEGDSTQPPPEKPKRTPRAVKFLLVCALLAAAGVGAYKLGWLAGMVRPIGGVDADKDPKAAFTRPVESNLVSAAPLLEDVGKSPVDPSKVLFPSFTKPLAPDSQDKPIACPTGTKDDPATPAATETAAAAPTPSTTAAPTAPTTATGPDNSVAPARELSPPDKTSPTLVETPVIVSRGPGEERGPQKGADDGRPQDRAAKPAGGVTKESAPKTGEKAGPSQGPVARISSESPPGPKSPPEPDKAKEPKYELPGSLVVKIKNYQGSTVKWGLMVILDDSAAMGRKTKLWDPNRIETAVALVGKLPETLTPGSKLAIRDFSCGSSTKKGGFCLSHALYDWNPAPFKELKDKLASVKKEGKNNPCAAAAYAIKKDLGGLGELAPRILIVTNGQTKCSYHDVLKVVGAHSAKTKPVVDVIGVGMGPRNGRAYAGLAKRTHGVFLKVDKPSELDGVVGRYGKILKAKVMEKLEVRGEKSVFTATPEEEIPLAPGTYRVVLPVVGKLNPSHRSIPDIKIVSGESKIMVVRIKNGRPVVRMGKK